MDFFLIPSLFNTKLHSCCTAFYGKSVVLHLSEGPFKDTLLKDSQREKKIKEKQPGTQQDSNLQPLNH